MYCDRTGVHFDGRSSDATLLCLFAGVDCHEYRILFCYELIGKLVRLQAA